MAQHKTVSNAELRHPDAHDASAVVRWLVSDRNDWRVLAHSGTEVVHPKAVDLVPCPAERLQYDQSRVLGDREVWTCSCLRPITCVKVTRRPPIGSRPEIPGTPPSAHFFQWPSCTGQTWPVFRHLQVSRSPRMVDPGRPPLQPWQSWSVRWHFSQLLIVTPLSWTIGWFPQPHPWSENELSPLLPVRLRKVRGMPGHRPGHDRRMTGKAVRASPGPARTGGGTNEPH